MSVIGRCSTSEFVRIGFSDDHRAGLSKFPNHMSIRNGPMLTESGSSVCRHNSGSVKNVLDRNWDSIERSESVTASGTYISCHGLSSRTVDH
jgi:hypothetical protein